VAIENTQLYNDLQHNLNSMTALNGLGMALNTTLRSPRQIYELTVGGMVALIDAAWGVALLRDGPDGALLLQPGAITGPAPANHPEVERLARAAIAQGRPQNARSASPQPIGTLIAVPLRATRSVLGAICVGFAEGLPSASDLESLGLFANQAAVAVESMQLFDAVRQGRDQLASIMASTREGMLLVNPDTSVAVANEAFRDLAEVAIWPPDGGWPADLQAMAISDLLRRWQAAVSYAPSELELLQSGLAAVADGIERFVGGQLGPPRPGHRALEWSVLRATPEGRAGAAASGADGAPARWPILLMLRDITAAKEAERLRQDLTSMMVHDLRSPLASIITSVDMILRETFGETNRRQREILAIASTSAEHLLNLVNLLLDISRLESGKMPLNCAPKLAHDLVCQAIERMAIISQNKSVAVVYEPPPAPLAVFADGDLVLRVLQNLLDNALKFSRRQSRVFVSLRLSASGDHVHIAVRDEGPGIHPRDREKIFVKFGQAQNRLAGGSGLGLTFCKLVVEAHGGTIGVESRLDRGSTFFFTLPVAMG
jgi:signal transduction histidine kinase